MDGDLRGVSQRMPEGGQSLAALYPTLRSPDVDQIMTVLVDVQAQIINPRPNASGVINDRERGTRRYRYGTLDVIIDLARPLLAAARVVTSNQLIERGNQKFVLTTLTHAPSQQYVGSEFPVDAGRHAHMDVKGLMTYGRRANLECLLNITSDTDADGGDGVPDEENTERTQRAADRVSSASARDWLLSKSWMPTPAATEFPPSTALRLLKAWRANTDIADQRFEPSKRAAWWDLRNCIVGCLVLAYGGEFGGAWGAVFDCKTADDVDVFRVRYDRECKAAIEHLRPAHPSAVSYLTEHLIFQAKAIEARAKLKIELDNEVGAVEARVAEAEAAASHQLLDCYGEPAGDPTKDRMTFARAYGNLFLATPIEDWSALDEHNEGALLWVGDDDAAVAYLNDLLGDLPGDVVPVSAQGDGVLSSAPAPSEGGDLTINVVAQHTDLAPTAAETRGDNDGSESGTTLDELMSSGVISLGMPAAADQPHDTAEGTENPPESAPPGQVDDRAWDEAPLRARIAVAVPTRGRTGAPDLAAYIDALTSDIESVNDQPTMRAWLAVNEPIYMATGFSQGTRVRAMHIATRRRILLGMPPSGDGEG